VPCRSPRFQLFDAHLHIVDPRFPLVANHGYVPDPFTVDDYRERLAGGAVVSGSFQAFDQDYLLDALRRLGPSFQVPPARDGNAAMEPALHAGLEHRLHHRVPVHKTVAALYPEASEFGAMPVVFATGFLVGLLEWACMCTIDPLLDAPRQLTLGTHIDISHFAPTPPGLEVEVHARLTRVDGRRLEFEVQAHDGVELISRGTHERFIVERESFDARVDRKRRTDTAAA
jgi:fluoroacetyl-CoA thioesterase